MAKAMLQQRLDDNAQKKLDSERELQAKKELNRRNEAESNNSGAANFVSKKKQMTRPAAEFMTDEALDEMVRCD